MADLIIDNVTVLTMDADRRVLPVGWISITGGAIEQVGEGSAEGMEANERIDGRGGVAMPGLVSTHQHVIDALLRGGIEQDRNLMDWLVNVYYAGTSAYRPEDTALAATVNMAEAIRAGVTTITDNWGVDNGDDAARVDECAEATLEVYRTSGIRMMFARMFSDAFPEYWGPLVGSLLGKVPGIQLNPGTLVEDTDRALASIESLMNKHHRSEGGRINVCPGPILPQTASPAGLLGSLDLARRFDTIVAIHHCESQFDAKIFVESGHGLSCTDYLNNLGFLDPRMLGAHCVWLDDRDIRLFKANDVKVAHCPSSNMFLASGVAPVPKMVAAGLTVGLGTDDTNTNSNVSIFTEMRHAALLAKVTNLDAGALTAEKALEMATIDGARAIGLGAEIGSIEAGKRADVILLDTDRPHWYPRYSLASVLVYQAHSDDVRDVVIDGRVVMLDRALSFLPPDEEAALYGKVQEASEAVIERAGMTSLRERGWQQESRI